MMSDSTYRFVARTLETTRSRLLRTRARMWCETCREMKLVPDYFTGTADCLLECSHRRPLFSIDVLLEFHAEQKRRGGKRISGSNNKSEILSVASVASVEETA